MNRILVLVVLLTAAAAAADTPAFVLEIEGGNVWQTVNDVESPNDGSATRFSLVDAAGKGPWTAGRAYLTWNINERHGLRALYAPLSIEEDGALDGPVTFEGVDFAPGAVRGGYRFDSYRLSYRYRFHHGADWTWHVGFTAKIRDAEISLEQGDDVALKDNTGFVPLLHLAAEWRVADGWRLLFDADALAGGPGRAEDVSLLSLIHI